MIHLFQQAVKEDIMRKVMRIIGVIIFVIAAAVVALVIKGSKEAKKTSVKENYYTEFSSSAAIKRFL